MRKRGRGLACCEKAKKKQGSAGTYLVDMTVDRPVAVNQLYPCEHRTVIPRILVADQLVWVGR